MLDEEEQEYDLKEFFNLSLSDAPVFVDDVFDTLLSKGFSVREAYALSKKIGLGYCGYAEAFNILNDKRLAYWFSNMTNLYNRAHMIEALIGEYRLDRYIRKKENKNG